MTYRVQILPRAQRDAARIFAWLQARSPAGATAWLNAYQGAVDQLAILAEQDGVAFEANKLRRTIREKLFNTSRGRHYRVLYEVQNDQVYVLSVRGPGQPRVRRRDLK